jgi:glycosyltransferase involved in cell wall biosynthesis
MESSRTYGIRGAMSLLKAKYRALKWRSKVEGVLAFGSQGVEYYVKAGFYSSIVQEWRYFGPSVREFGDEQLTNAGDSEYDVAFVGKLDIRKNVSILLEAVSILKMRAEKKLRVIIVGDGPELEKLKSLADDLDVAEQIRFLSSVDNNHVFKVLKGSKMLVLPSLHDGWGYVVNEGLSAGCNVIVSKKCGSSSIFERKKLSGYSIFDPLSPEDLASGIVEALNAWSNLSRSENIRFFNEELSSQKGLEMLEGLAS